MSDVLIPVLEDFNKRLERIEEMLLEMKGEKPKKEQDPTLQMDEIQDYLQKIQMA